MKFKNEISFGFFALLTIGLILYGLNYMSGSKFFGPPLVLYAQYDDLKGLIKGNPILINGLKVGRVGSLNLDMEEGLATVALEFDQSLDIPQNSQAQIYSIDLLGSKGIKVFVPDTVPASDIFLESNASIEGTHEVSVLDRAGNVIETQGYQILIEVGRLSVQLNEIVRLTKEMITDQNNNNSLRATLENIKMTSDNLTSITNEVDSIARDFKGISRDAASIVGNFEENNANITDILDNAKEITGNLADASSNIDSLVADATSAVASVENMVSSLDTTSGTLGLLLNDTQLYDSLTVATGNVNALLRVITNNPQQFFDDIKLYLNMRRPKEAKREEEPDNK